MFLHDLSPEQRRAFLVLARNVIDADSRLAIQELERLDRLYLEAGVGTETASAPATAGDLHLLFGTERTRVAVLLELILVAYVDGRMHPSEADAVRSVAAQLRVDAGTFEHALDWGRRHQELLEEAEEMVGAVA